MLVRSELSVQSYQVREHCPMRNPSNGNCLPHGGFCLAVSDNICDACRSAYRMGKIAKFLEGVVHHENSNRSSND